MEEDDWDSMLAIHLKGHFNFTRHAAAYWRDQSEAGKQVRAAIVNTASPAAFTRGDPTPPPPGSSIPEGRQTAATQVHYSSAKAAICALTHTSAQELAP